MWKARICLLHQQGSVYAEQLKKGKTYDSEETQTHRDSAQSCFTPHRSGCSLKGTNMFYA